MLKPFFVRVAEKQKNRLNSFMKSIEESRRNGLLVEGGRLINAVKVEFDSLFLYHALIA